jgi:hypothetical protein
LYDEDVKAKLCAALSLVAIVATIIGAVRFPAGTHASSVRYQDLARTSAAATIPEGFILPASDAGVRVSSFVAADLDADGDLDIVAADRSNGAIGIVVWVNDGAGRLTRKAPTAPQRNLAGEPASPSIDHREAAVVASLQPNGPAVETISANTWLVLPVRRCELARSAAPESATPATLRSRSPPVLS